MKTLTRFRTVAALAFVLPALLAGLTVTAVAAGTQAASPAPGGGAALPGDPAKGATLYGASGCSACHGASLGGGVGPPLRPIKDLGDAGGKPLDPQYLITTLTNGKNGVGGYGQMPAKGGKGDLTDQDIKDLAAYIIAQNSIKGPVPLSGGDLARSTVGWVTLGIVGMLALTFMLSKYNMRWIDRKARANRGEL